MKTRYTIVYADSDGNHFTLRQPLVGDAITVTGTMGGADAVQAIADIALELTELTGPKVVAA